MKRSRGISVFINIKIGGNVLLNSQHIIAYSSFKRGKTIITLKKYGKYMKLDFQAGLISEEQ